MVPRADGMGALYEYRDGSREIGERVINELERCEDTIAFSIISITSLNLQL